MVIRSSGVQWSLPPFSCPEYEGSDESGESYEPNDSGGFGDSCDSGETVGSGESGGFGEFGYSGDLGESVIKNQPKSLKKLVLHTAPGRKAVLSFRLS